MANTRTSTKRARQADSRQERNRIVRSATRTAVRNAVTALKAGDLAQAKLAYQAAIRSLGKAGSKGAIPKARAARKISRLTLLTKKLQAAVLK